MRLIRNDGDAPILSLCAPSSLPALVAGPLAALIVGAPLHYLAPFESARFLATIDALGPTRLVAPAMLLPDLAKAGLLTGGSLLSVTALRHAAAPAFDGPAECAVVELSMRNGRLALS